MIVLPDGTPYTGPVIPEKVTVSEFEENAEKALSRYLRGEYGHGDAELISQISFETSHWKGDRGAR